MAHLAKVVRSVRSLHLLTSLRAAAAFDPKYGTYCREIECELIKIVGEGLDAMADLGKVDCGLAVLDPV